MRMTEKAKAEVKTEKADSEVVNTITASDALRLDSVVRNYQQQVLGLVSIAMGPMRFVTGHAQAQLDYIAALTRCQDLAGIASVNAEYAKRMAQNVTRTWNAFANVTPARD